MPGMKAVGMKTAERTSAMPTTGPEISCMALESGFLWRETIFDVALDGFDDDDGVIDDEADGQNQAEQRERVDGKAE